MFVWLFDMVNWNRKVEPPTAAKFTKKALDSMNFVNLGAVGTRFGAGFVPAAPLGGEGCRTEHRP